MEIQTTPCGNLPNSEELHGEMRRALQLISGKWKLEILWLLNRRVHRFGELRRAIPGITQHMLTAQLRELEADGLVSRQIFAEVPLHVEYAITPAAMGLAPTLDSLLAWWLEHRLPAAAER